MKKSISKNSYQCLLLEAIIIKKETNIIYIEKNLNCSIKNRIEIQSLN